MKPTTYPFGTKRLPLDTNYFETFNRDNVALVDLIGHADRVLYPGGIRTSAARDRLDVIVFATGFDALTGPLFAIDIRGRGGIRLREKWAEGPRTYLGLGTVWVPELVHYHRSGKPVGAQ